MSLLVSDALLREGIQYSMGSMSMRGVWVVSLICLAQMLATYFPLMNHAILTGLKRVGISTWTEDGVDAVDEEAELIEQQLEQYEAFTDDRRVLVVEGDETPIERLMKHKYKKFKYVSKGFLLRNKLQGAALKKSSRPVKKAVTGQDELNNTKRKKRRKRSLS